MQLLFLIQTDNIDNQT